MQSLKDGGKIVSTGIRLYKTHRDQIVQNTHMLNKKKHCTKRLVGINQQSGSERKAGGFNREYSGTRTLGL